MHTETAAGCKQASGNQRQANGVTPKTERLFHCDVSGGWSQNFAGSNNPLLFRSEFSSAKYRTTGRAVVVERDPSENGIRDGPLKEAVPVKILNQSAR